MRLLKLKAIVGGKIIVALSALIEPPYFIKRYTIENQPFMLCTFDRKKRFLLAAFMFLPPFSSKTASQSPIFTLTRRAFTLIELIVVIAIIAILAAIIAPNAFRAIEKAKISKAAADVRHIHHACGALYADTGHWPTTDQNRIRNSELMSNLYGWSGWDGPYLENSDDTHPWGGTYRFWTAWNIGEGNANDLTICFDRVNFNNGTVGHSPPLSSSLKIDRINDDGNLSTGAIRTSGSYNELFWVLVWDAF